MRAVLLRFRTELWRRRAATLGLVALLGLVGGMALAAAAGARRTATAPDRLVAAVGGEGDAAIFDVGGADPDRIAALPQVAETAAQGFILADSVPLTGIEIVVSDNPGFSATVVDGRLPDPADPLSVAVDQGSARRLGVGTGDQLDVVLVTYAQLDAIDPDTEPIPAATVRVAAVVREPDDLVVGDPAAALTSGINNQVHVTPAFYERFGAQTTLVNTVYSYKLADGASGRGGFVAAVRALPQGDTVEFFEPPGLERGTQRAVDAQAAALALFAAVLGLAGALSAGQSLSRQIVADAGDGDALRALGMTDGQRVAVAVLRGALVGVPAAAVAVATAVAWSPLTPVGLARQAEPHPGAEVNVALLVLGGTVIACAMAAQAAGTAWRIVRPGDRRPAGARPVAERLARAGASPPLVTGLSLAAARRRAGVSAPSTLVSVTAAVAAVAAAATFLASLDRLVDDPARYGWDFDAVVGSIYDDEPGDLAAIVASDPGVDEFALATGASATADGHRIGVIGVEPGRGIEAATLLRGRPPAGPREAVLGPRTVEALDRSVGDAVVLDGGSGPVEFRITGVAVVPEINQAGPGLGEGAVVTLASLQALAPGAQPNIALVRFAPGGRESEAMTRFAFVGELMPPVLPDALYDVERVRGLPLVLAVLLALLGVATLVHSLVSLVRSRRRDLALLKTLGFTRAQVAATTAWQGTVVAAVALVAGLPLGVAAGRWLWIVVADQLGVPPAPRVPVVALLLVVPATLVAANAAAVLPGWMAARTRPGQVLRAE